MYVRKRQKAQGKRSFHQRNGVVDAYCTGIVRVAPRGGGGSLTSEPLTENIACSFAVPSCCLAVLFCPSVLYFLSELTTAQPTDRYSSQRCPLSTASIPEATATWPRAAPFSKKSAGESTFRWVFTSGDSPVRFHHAVLRAQRSRDRQNRSVSHDDEYQLRARSFLTSCVSVVDIRPTNQNSVLDCPSRVGWRHWLTHQRWWRRRQT